MFSGKLPLLPTPMNVALTNRFQRPYQCQRWQGRKRGLGKEWVCTAVTPPSQQPTTTQHARDTSVASRVLLSFIIIIMFFTLLTTCYLQIQPRETASLRLGLDSPGKFILLLFIHFIDNFLPIGFIYGPHYQNVSKTNREDE